jgi:hypothetical protein
LELKQPGFQSLPRQTCEKFVRHFFKGKVDEWVKILHQCYKTRGPIDLITVCLYKYLMFGLEEKLILKPEPLTKCILDIAIRTPTFDKLVKQFKTLDGYRIQCKVEFHEQLVLKSMPD